MSKLTNIFSEIELYESNKVNYYATELVKSYSLNENKRFKPETVSNHLYYQALAYDSLEESLDFLKKVDEAINEGFFGNAMNKAAEMAKRAVSAVKDTISNIWSGPYIAALKKWNNNINRIADSYEGIKESKFTMNKIDYLITETDENEDENEEDDDIQGTKEYKNFLIKVIKYSDVKDNSDGFYTRMHLDPTKLFGTSGNFFKFAAKYQFDFIPILRHSNHQPVNFKPMTDLEMYAYAANMSRILGVIKRKKLIPPGEDEQNFIPKFIKPALKYTFEMNKVLNRETLESDGTNDQPQTPQVEPEAPQTGVKTGAETAPQTGVKTGAETAPQAGAETAPQTPQAGTETGAETAPQTPQAGTETPAKDGVDKKLQAINEFTKANPTFMNKLKNMSDEDKIVMIQAIEKFNISTKDLDEIITQTDFLENGINIVEKLKYIKELQQAGLPNNKIIPVIKYIMDEKIEKNFNRNPILKDIKSIVTTINERGNLNTIEDKIFDNTEL